MIPYDLGAASAAWMALAIFGGAFLRGYSGFGFSALVVTASGLVTNPLNSVAMVLFCELLMSLQSYRGIRGQVDWRRVWLLLFGAMVGMPVGIWVLVSLPENAARIAISGFVLLMCLVLWRGFSLPRAAGTGQTFAAGLASGLANGPGMGGLPVAAFFAAQPMPASMFRATLIAYFPLLDLFSLPIYWLSGLISRDSFTATALALPLVIAGNALGARHFFAADPQGFRRFALLLLALLAFLGLGRSLL